MVESDNEERTKWIGAAFALLTAKLEDAAGLAVDGQARSPEAERREIARQITDLTEEAAIIGGILEALLEAASDKQ